MSESAGWSETLIRRVWLDRPLARSVLATNLATGETAPIDADWAGISQINDDGQTSFMLYLCSSAGDVLEALQNDTLRIAFDQAWNITGVAPAHWIRCSIDASADGALRWNPVLEPRSD